MVQMRFALSPGVIVEELGEEFLIFAGPLGEVVKLGDESAAVLRSVRDGHSVEAALAVVKDLESRGIIKAVGGLSRRAVITSGVAGAGVGLLTLAMPSVAAAASSNVVEFELLGVSNFVGSGDALEYRFWWEDDPGLPTDGTVDGVFTLSDGVTTYNAVYADVGDPNPPATWNVDFRPGVPQANADGGSLRVTFDFGGVSYLGTWTAP